MQIFNGTIGSLEKALNYSATKNKTLSQNIANVDTPHYSAKRVIFKDILDQESNKASRTHVKHIPFSDESLGYRVISNKKTAYNHNGNNVDIDLEMAQLAENQIYYNSLVDRLNGKMGSLQTVIRGGR